ncbi:hypothetical protein RvY_12118 [Ramazzottius varieornatus]|uniref:Beta-1,4-N-acetylgalactosaminyltransferase n=1 Tax=Ramazzottius varieornatus TaxID=947166 RepID=A0A1D1VKR4_RAMVA|nr:hypothetical protein RvY_12118 [Ramazzottius varieornatus]
MSPHTDDGDFIEDGNLQEDYTDRKKMINLGYRRLSNGGTKSASPPPPHAISGFCRAHVYKAMVVVIGCLVLFEFSSMVLSDQRQMWLPSFPGYHYAIRQWKAKVFDPRVLSCNGTGCWDQFGSMYELAENRSDTTVHTPAVANRTVQTVLMSLLGMDTCPLVPPNLVGAIRVLSEKLPEEDIVRANTGLQPGGRFRPSHCLARHKVAIILPYRDRPEHLRIFLNNIHPILRRQQLDYGIFVVEQAGLTKFNRGTLMNVGYVEARKSYDYDCFIFHDVDLLPENDRNLYSCPGLGARHMSVAIDKFNYHLPYKTILGGISAFTDAQFAKINGFPNIYWGWGGEDDDLSIRVRSHGFNITRYPAAIARYKMIKHDADPSNPANPVRFELLKFAAKRFKSDGLNNLKYKLIDSQLRPLYTWLLVDIGSPPDSRR